MTFLVVRNSSIAFYITHTDATETLVSATFTPIVALDRTMRFLADFS
jgi:phage terminase large subunit-like protein